jgi:hypothetical protein
MPVLPSLVPGGSPEKANNGRPSTTPDRSSKMAKSSSVILPGKSGGGDPLAGGNSIQSGKDDWFGDFLSRQTNATQEIRLHLSKTTREFLATDLSEQIIAKTTGIVAFRQLLRRRYGSLTASWRQLFDPEGKGKVTFQHFCECCRDLGFQRKMRGLWKELVEQQGRGYMSLDQLDPEAARLMSSFRQDAREFVSLTGLRFHSALFDVFSALVEIVLPALTPSTPFFEDGQSHESYEGDGSHEGHEGYEEEADFGKACQAPCFLWQARQDSVWSPED